MTDLNRKLAEKFGLCWHGLYDINFEKSNNERPPNIICHCTCGLTTFFYEPDFHWCITNQDLLETFSCGIENPNFTDSVPLLREHMERIGEWEGFIEWHLNQCLIHRREAPIWGYKTDFHFEAHADILTDPALLAQATLEYLEGK